MSQGFPTASLDNQYPLSLDHNHIFALILITSACQHELRLLLFVCVCVCVDAGQGEGSMYCHL